MKFYDRKDQLRQLDEIRRRSFEKHSQMTVVTGRRRIGKTKLILKSCEGTPTVYLFVSRSSEAVLCAQFSKTARSELNLPVPEGIKSFVEFFSLLMTYGRMTPFNLIIDEFQEFFTINPSIYSGMQDVWDRNKDETHVNFIASGSVNSLMHRIFMDYKEPLYGRCDTVMRLRPFTTEVIREILRDHYPEYTDDDLLALYTITGGVPKYIELLMDRDAFTVKEMIAKVAEENSIFIDEGTILLSQEFGKKYGNYFSILSSIALGWTTIAEISQTVGEDNLGGMMSRLEEDYEIITKKRPIFSKERSQNVRYEIADNFLRFWFRYMSRNQDLIQMGQYNRLAEIIEADYTTYSGLTLERWFRQRMEESGRYLTVGSWWNNAKGAGGAQNEIDIIGIDADDKKHAFVAEVKRKAGNFKPELFEEKVNHLSDKILHGYSIETRLLTLSDMQKFHKEDF